jgi:hypothetical protein
MSKRSNAVSNPVLIPDSILASNKFRILNTGFGHAIILFLLLPIITGSSNTISEIFITDKLTTERNIRKKNFGVNDYRIYIHHNGFCNNF